MTHTTKNLLLILASLFIFTTGHAQKYIIKGAAKDTVGYATTQYTSVSLIRAADSVLQTFTRADEGGNFSLSVDTPGKYVIIIAHPLFADYVDVVETSGPVTDLGTIALISRQQLLQEVIINDNRPITIKGDTTEYLADSFRVREFANVDELLKKLPGLQVDKNGNITAHGEKVQKMLVDGDEFFADDPAVVAKMLRASAVDKVQVYDKKSDQAEFTGIDDGEKIKTINLKLKENAKKGYFGKVSAGAGPPKYWENQAMINAFKAKRKISAFGIMSNTNTNGLGWSDNGKYGGSSGSSFEMTDDGTMISTYNSGDDESFGGSYTGEGLPKNWTGGFHYGNKWLDKDALNFNGDYRFRRSNIETFNNTRTQYTLPDTQYVTNSNSNRFSTSDGHNVSTVTEYKIDSLTSLKVNIGGKLNHGINRTENDVNSTDLDGDPINSSSQFQDYTSDAKSLNTNILYRRKFNKEGRTISANFTGNWTENSTAGTYRSINNFYAVDSVDTIQQRKDNLSQGLKLNTRLSYTEPLSKKVFLEVNYSFDVNNNESKRLSFDQAGEVPGVLDTLIPLFSSNYAFNIITNNGGANLRFKFEKFNFSFGGNVANANFHQRNKFDNTELSYSYLNFFPRASLRFNRTKQSNIGFNYNGSTNQPTISQLQPIRENTDPLNIMIGNPNLKQEFRHNFSLNFGDYKVLSERYIWTSADFSFTQDAISQKQSINEIGQRTYQYVNVNGNFMANVYAGYGFKIKPINTRANLNLTGAYIRSNSFVNDLTNVSINQNYGPTLSFYYSKDTLLDLNYSTNLQYNRNTSSIRKDIVNDYWSYQQEFNGSIHLPLNFEIGATVEWFIRQKIDAQDANNNVFRLNAYVSKSFLKDRSLVLKAAGYDILNQNIGFRRNSFDNYITESRYNNIRRYFMFSLTWNFTKSGAMAPAQEVNIIGGD